MTNNRYDVKDIYDYYKSKGGKVNRKLFSTILFAFNKRVSEHLAEGKEFSLGSRLSTLQLVKIRRDFSKNVVNWYETNLLKKQLLKEGKTIKSKDNPDGENYIVYYTDDYYLALYWFKIYCIVQNKKYFNFVISEKILKPLLAKLRKDPLKLSKIKYLHDIPKYKFKANHI